jgi:hypothetical protein
MLSQFYPSFNVAAHVPDTFNFSSFAYSHGVLLDSLFKKRRLAQTEVSRRHYNQVLELLYQMDAGTMCWGWLFGLAFGR